MLMFLSHLHHRRNWEKMPSSLPYSPHHTPTFHELKEGYSQLWSSTRTTKPEGKSRMRPPASTSGPPSCSLHPPSTATESRASSHQEPPLSPLALHRPFSRPLPLPTAGRRPVSASSSSAANPETCLSHPQPHPGCSRGGHGAASSCAFRFLLPSCLSRTLPGPPASSYTYPSPLPCTTILPLLETELCVSEGTGRLWSGGGGALWAPRGGLGNPGESWKLGPSLPEASASRTAIRRMIWGLLGPVTQPPTHFSPKVSSSPAFLATPTFASPALCPGLWPGWNWAQLNSATHSTSKQGCYFFSPWSRHHPAWPPLLLSKPASHSSLKVKVRAREPFSNWHADCLTRKAREEWEVAEWHSETCCCFPSFWNASYNEWERIWQVWGFSEIPRSKNADNSVSLRSR